MISGCKCLLIIFSNILYAIYITLTYPKAFHQERKKERFNFVIQTPNYASQWALRLIFLNKAKEFQKEGRSGTELEREREMGRGKLIQCLCHLAWLFSESSNICSASQTLEMAWVHINLNILQSPPNPSPSPRRSVPRWRASAVGCMDFHLTFYYSLYSFLTNRFFYVLWGPRNRRTLLLCLFGFFFHIVEFGNTFIRRNKTPALLYCSPSCPCVGVIIISSNNCLSLLCSFSIKYTHGRINVWINQKVYPKFKQKK